GSSSELEPGDFLYVVGFPYEFRRQLTHGRISSSYGVISSADVNPGNSGGPAYALRDGKPELVGLTQTTRRCGISGFIPVDAVKRFLSSIGLYNLCGGR
ncbi:S1C family serine protease, partial [Candidatus Woesearchaeota archaeon]|nr:S1C family serine protease [Candidatus Woesearchaeota archaeon]